MEEGRIAGTGEKEGTEITGANTSVAEDMAVDISDIKLDMKQPKEKRIESYIRQTGNPYRVRMGKVLVEIEYSGNGQRMQEILMDTMAEQT